MSPFRFGLLLAALGACASARNDPHGDDGSAVPDASSSIDAQRGSAAADAAQSGCTQASTGVLATWDFTGETGNQQTTAVKTVVHGVVAGAVQRSTGVTAVTGANAMNASNWSLATQVDLTKYYALTVAPPSGCSLAITKVAVDAKASGTGPAMGAIATAADNFTQATAISTAGPSTPTFTIPAQTAPLELRIYGYGATNTAGTLRLQTTLSITGTLQ